MQHQVNLSYSVFLWKVIFYYKMFRKSLVSLVTFLWNVEQNFALQNPGPDCTYVKH